jgi:Skp family chaperone for outer membrane proteins
VRKLLLSAAVFGVIAAAGRTAPAQQPQPGATPVGHGANASRYGIAVVDISYIFKSYPGFTQQIEALKKDMEAADGTLKADRDRLVRMEEERNTLKPGTDKFKQLDEQLAHQKAEFSIKQGTVRRDFLEREAQVYYQTYTQVSEAVKTYAQQNNIGMVLRFNGDQIDPHQREDVMRLIMQPIVHQNHIDITPDVIAVLTRGGVPAAAVSPTAKLPSATQFK